VQDHTEHVLVLLDPARAVLALDLRRPVRVPLAAHGTRHAREHVEHERLGVLPCHDPSIGTNFGIQRPVGTILFDEKIGGTVHLALGRSYPETGGKNESALHWDLICDLRKGGRITADGETVQQDGRFVVDR
jgi:aminopeptidase